MASFIKVPSADAGDDEGREILVNLDQVLWVDEVEGRATLEFPGNVVRGLTLTLDQFYALVRGR